MKRLGRQFDTIVGTAADRNKIGDFAVRRTKIQLHKERRSHQTTFIHDIGQCCIDELVFEASYEWQTEEVADGEH